MIIYVETSVILRKLLNQKGVLRGWGKWKEATTSQLSVVEVMRALHRLHFTKTIDAADLASLIQLSEEIFAGFFQIEVNAVVLSEASKAFASSIKTLDAIHLASALLWQEEVKKDLLFLTHDVQLGQVAIASGAVVKGI